MTRRTMFGPDQIDNLGQAIITLTRELWVTRDRLLVLEEQLRAAGIDVDPDKFVPDPAQAAKLLKEREKLIDELFAAFLHEAPGI